METVASDLSGIEIFFLICALVGGVLLVVRFVMQIVGADGAGDGSGLEAHHLDADASPKLLSVHGLTAFLMMFGRGGFALYRQSEAGTVLSLVGALAAGLASFWIIGRLFVWIARLQSSGTVSLEDAVGCTGEVYMTIPRQGTGRVTVRYKDRLREHDAVSREDRDLKTGERIKVLGVRGSALVVGTE